MRLGEDNDYIYREVLRLTEAGVRQPEGPGPHRDGLRGAREVVRP